MKVETTYDVRVVNIIIGSYLKGKKEEECWDLPLPLFLTPVTDRYDEVVNIGCSQAIRMKSIAI
jgi:hypothetical protein